MDVCNQNIIDAATVDHQGDTSTWRKIILRQIEPLWYAKKLAVQLAHVQRQASLGSVPRVISQLQRIYRNLPPRRHGNAAILAQGIVYAQTVNSSMVTALPSYRPREVHRVPDGD